jgi:hypothetical protein
VNLSCSTYSLKALYFFDTLFIANFDLMVKHVSNPASEPEYEILAEFLLRCANSLLTVSLRKREFYPYCLYAKGFHESTEIDGQTMPFKKCEGEVVP